jgi:hypothetical protein
MISIAQRSLILCRVDGDCHSWNTVLGVLVAIEKDVNFSERYLTTHQTV